MSIPAAIAVGGAALPFVVNGVSNLIHKIKGGSISEVPPALSNNTVNRAVEPTSVEKIANNALNEQAVPQVLTQQQTVLVDAYGTQDPSPYFVFNTTTSGNEIKFTGANSSELLMMNNINFCFKIDKIRETAKPGAGVGTVYKDVPAYNDAPKNLYICEPFWWTRFFSRVRVLINSYEFLVIDSDTLQACCVASQTLYPNNLFYTGAIERQMRMKKNGGGFTHEFSLDRVWLKGDPLLSTRYFTFQLPLSIFNLSNCLMPNNLIEFSFTPSNQEVGIIATRGEKAASSISDHGAVEPYHALCHFKLDTSASSVCFVDFLPISQKQKIEILSPVNGVPVRNQFMYETYNNKAFSITDVANLTSPAGSSTLATFPFSTQRYTHTIQTQGLIPSFFVVVPRAKYKVAPLLANYTDYYGFTDEVYMLEPWRWCEHRQYINSREYGVWPLEGVFSNADRPFTNYVEKWKYKHRLATNALRSHNQLTMESMSLLLNSIQKQVSADTIIQHPYSVNLDTNGATTWSTMQYAEMEELREMGFPIITTQSVSSINMIQPLRSGQFDITFDLCRIPCGNLDNGKIGGMLPTFPLTAVGGLVYELERIDILYIGLQEEQLTYNSSINAHKDSISALAGSRDGITY